MFLLSYGLAYYRRYDVACERCKVKLLDRITLFFSLFCFQFTRESLSCEQLIFKWYVGLATACVIWLADAGEMEKENRYIGAYEYLG